MELNYPTPEIEVLELIQEGVLCGSNEQMEEEWGEWDIIKDITY